MTLLNPWVILALVLAVSSAGAGGAVLGKRYADGQHAQAALLIEKAGEAAQAAAAGEIAKIQIVNQTHRQVIERETRVVPDYSQCHHTEEVLRVLNDALAGRR